MPKVLSVTVVALALIFCLSSLSFPEDITITTYYPSPYGSYNQLTTADNTYLATSGGSVGIGTTTPGAKLEVAGQVKITGGLPGADKVLTSDANGMASWQAGSGGVTTQNVVTGSRAVDTVYQNTHSTTMFVTVTLSAVLSGGSLAVYTDAASPPTVGVACGRYDTGMTKTPVSFLVLPGNYYLLTVLVGVPTIEVWTEWY